ncbi:hypothetical protein CHS0354_016108 [Potamilus streckersoni]|uniref:Receptor ligand binding region domain-containing protein n=1 Tax=Potamilus streckersoni TaxID=2493646 RepID=A0AAE0T113_9BIVA|nr:hypothetical protein CHS0354_016108 [Potamilus streckersoni]
MVIHVSYIFIILPIFVLGNQNCSVSLGFMNDTTTVKFSVLMTLRESHDGVTCGPILESQLQLLAAVQMTVDKLNTPAYLPSMQIGYEVYDDCGLDWFAEQAIHHAFGCDPAISDNHCSSVPNQARHIGLLGLSRSMTSEGIYKSLNQLEVPVISPFSSISWEGAASNIRTTTASMEREVAFMVKMLKVANWTYVTAVYTDDDYGTFGLGNLTKLAVKEGICVHTIGSLSSTETPSDVNGLINKLITSKRDANISVIGIIFFGRGPSGKVFFRALKDNRDVQPVELIVSEGMEEYRNMFASEIKLPKGAIIVHHVSYYLPSFDQYYNDKIRSFNITPMDPVESMFIQFQTKTGHLPAEVDNNTRNANVFSVMDAVYTLANAYRKAYSDKCGTMSGICKQLEEVSWQQKADYVRSVNGRYSDINAPNLPHELQRENISVGNNKELEAFAYIPTGVGMVMSDSYFSEYMSLWTPSVCKGTCSQCLATSDPYPFGYLDGDQLLLGIFSTHESSTTDPFGCGSFKDFSVQGILPEVFLYALQVARQQTGVNFGAVIFNVCESASRATLIISKFMAGEIKVRKPGTNEIIDPTKIRLVVGAHFSGTTVPMTMFFTGLSLPVVSFTASSPDLDDRIDFPYFLRTVPSDVDQAKAMLQIIKTMGWEYVSVLYVDNNYGRKAQKAFIDFAKNEGICVMEPIVALSQTGDSKEDYNILTILRDQSPKVVILFATEARIATLVSLLNEQRKLGIQNRFIFLASEDWGKSTHILKEGGETCLGSITMALESSKSADNGFHNYITQRTPGTIKNPWFDLLWMEQFKCFLNNNFENKYHTPCSMSDRIPDDKARSWADNQRAVHLINAVLAIAHGLKQAKDKLCANKGFICPEYFKNITEVVRIIRNIELSGGGIKFRVFDDNGNGNVGFEILNIKLSGLNQPDYQTVGTFVGNSLLLEKRELQFYHGNIDAKCDAMLCAKCNQQKSSSPSANPSISSNVEFGNRDIDFAIVSLLVIMCILIVAKTVYDSCRTRDLASTSSGNNYNDESVRENYEIPEARYTDSHLPHASDTSRPIPQGFSKKAKHESHIYDSTKDCDVA